MPAPARINPHLVQILFGYNPDSGELTPKPTAQRAAYRTAKNQWEIGEHRYSVHRLIWAWHNPNDANPYAVQFIDGDTKNTRIENLHAIRTNPRWLDHGKKPRMYMRVDGTLVPAGRGNQSSTPDGMPVPQQRPVTVRASVQRRAEQLEVGMRNFEEEVLSSVNLIATPKSTPHNTELDAIVNTWDD